MAFTIAEDGSLSDRRVWAQFDDVGVGKHRNDFSGRVTPDGICLDAEGAIWLASPGIDSPALLRVREGGESTHRLEGAFKPIACLLGGQDGRTLFVTGKALDDRGQPMPEPNGCIIKYQVDVPHAGLP